MTTKTTVEPVFEDQGLTPDSAAEALLKQFGVTEDEEDGESPSESSKDTDGESQDDTPEQQEEESQSTEERDTTDDGEDSEEEDSDEEDESADDEDDEEDSDDEGTDEEEEPSVASDDATVTVEVNGESKEFKVGDLKRLAGQEAALTQKSQEVSESKQQYEEGLKAQRTGLEEMMNRAAKRFEPYKDIDWNLAAQQYDPETYKALKEEAQSAYSDMQFFQNELSQLVQKQDQERQQQLREQAQEAVKILQDPEKGIPGFDRELFTQLRDYGIEQGISASDMDQMVHPGAWKMLHKAREYDRLQQAQQGAKPAKKKVRRKVKTGKTQPSSKASQERASKKQAQDIASKSGLDAIEAAAEALVAGWGNDS
jgi:hypothetical protein